MITYVGTYNTLLLAYTNNQCSLYNSSITTFINASIVSYNTSVTAAFTNLQNLSSVNSSFLYVNISNLSCISASFNYINCSNISCTDLYNFINTSIIKNANNYNSSLILPYITLLLIQKMSNFSGLSHSYSFVVRDITLLLIRREGYHTFTDWGGPIFHALCELFYGTSDFANGIQFE